MRLQALGLFLTLSCLAAGQDNVAPTPRYVIAAPPGSSSASGQSTMEAILADAQRATLPELLAALYLKSDAYFQVDARSSFSLATFDWEYHTEAFTRYTEGNPRFRRAHGLLAALPPTERDALLREHLREALRQYDQRFRENVLVKLDATTSTPLQPLDPGLDTGNSTNGSPTLDCLRLGIVSLLRLAADLKAEGVHTEAVALCDYAHTQRERLMKHLRQDPQEFNRVINISLYVPVPLCAALKRTAPAGSPIHAVWADLAEEIRPAFEKLSGSTAQLPAADALPYLPIMTDAHFDTLFAAGKTK